MIGSATRRSTKIATLSAPAVSTRLPSTGAEVQPQLGANDKPRLSAAIPRPNRSAPIAPRPIGKLT